MKRVRKMNQLGTGIILITGVLLVFGAIAPGLSPVTVTTPVSESMEPTAPTHSLVVIVSTTADPGDIILFDSAQQEKPVLHRIVGVSDTDDGYITQGDANKVPDQDLGMDSVSDKQINGVVPTIAGHPIIIPHAGSVLTNPVVLLGTWALLALSLLYTTKVGKITRGAATTIPIRKYAVVLAVLIMVGTPIATAVFAVPAQTEIVTSTTASAASSDIAEPGGVSERTVTVSSPFFAVLRTTATLEGDLVLQTAENSFGEQTAEISVRNQPSDVPTIHKGTIKIYSYPAVLPTSISSPIVAIHPIAASFANSFIIGVAVIIVGLAFDKRKIVRSSHRKLRQHRNNRN